MSSKSAKVLLLLIGAAVSAQLIPVDRSNPPIKSALAAPEQVMSVLRRSCYDCHSNETRWPWYSRIAPISWLVAHDVQEGREHLNYSTWGEYSAKQRRELQEETREVVEEGEMPPWVYLPPHPEARLSDADKQVLMGWTRRGS